MAKQKRFMKNLKYFNPPGILDASKTDFANRGDDGRNNTNKNKFNKKPKRKRR